MSGFSAESGAGDVVSASASSSSVRVTGAIAGTMNEHQLSVGFAPPSKVGGGHLRGDAGTIPETAESSDIDVHAETFVGSAVWSRHSSFLASCVQRMYEEKFGLDYLLMSTDGKNVPVHSIIFASFSSAFAASVASEAQASNSSHAYQTPLQAPTLRRLVAYAYTGRLHLDRSCAMRVFEGARAMGMDSAVQIVAAWLRKSLTTQNVLRIWTAARQNKGASVSNLLSTIDAYVCDYFPVVTMLNDWIQLPSSLVQVWLTKDDLLVPNEYAIVQALERWTYASMLGGSGRARDRIGIENIVVPPARVAAFTTLAVTCIRFCYLSEAELHMLATHPLAQPNGSIAVSVARERRRREAIRAVKTKMKRAEHLRDDRLAAARRDFQKEKENPVDDDSDDAISSAAFDGAMESIASMDEEAATRALGERCPVPRRYTDASMSPEALRELAPVCDEGSELEKRLDVIAWFDYGVQAPPQMPRHEIPPHHQVEWDADAPLLEVRGEFAVAAVGDAVFLFAGCSNEKSLLSVECRVPCQDRDGDGDARRKYEWRESSIMSTARIDPAACTLDVCNVEGHCCHGAAIAIAGGCAANGKVMRSVQIFVPGTGAWSELPSMLVSRSSFGMCAGEGRAYAVGGANNQSTALASCEVYDPWANAWMAMPPLGKARWANSAVVVGGTLYAIGGVDEDENIVAVTECIPIQTCAWSTPECPRVWSETSYMVKPRHSFGVAVHDGKIYAVEGRDAVGKDLDSVEVFDPRRGYWVELSRRLAQPRSSLKCAAVCGGILAIGGCSGDVWLNTVERIDFGAFACIE